MLICGIKLTHDGSIAVIDCSPDIPKLLFSIEMEKLKNNPRYDRIHDLKIIDKVLCENGVPPQTIDRWVIDGWKHGVALGQPVEFYHEFEQHATGSILDSNRTGHLNIGRMRVPYKSYRHMASHIVGTYVTSPFGLTCDPVYVVTWDGGQNPRVYFVDPEADPQVMYVGTVMEFYGIIYSIMGYYFGPYKNPEVMKEPNISASNPLYGGYETPGKLMSYIALGVINQPLRQELITVYLDMEQRHRSELGDQVLGYHQNGIFEHAFMRRVERLNQLHGLDDATVLRTIHSVLEHLLVERTKQLVPKNSLLMFTGGSALNIKWNSALRDSGHFAEVWVPPFPNDTGTALGAAACEMVHELGCWALDWSVYAGPQLMLGGVRAGRRMSVEGLAKFFADNPSTPVVVLNGRAELGPRALGNRSILAAATLPSNKAHLNAIKRRENFRPVAPICLEHLAPEVFTPGTPDPHMLFEHWVRQDWLDRVPAIAHLDNSARLQTVSHEDNPIIHELLVHYFRLTGIPLLCNTSANYNGKGFFPDVESALRWGEVEHVWSNGVMFDRSCLIN